MGDNAKSKTQLLDELIHLRQRVAELEAAQAGCQQGVAALIGAGDDITESKPMETTLHRYERIVSATADWISLVDRSYIYQIINEAYSVRHKKTYDQIVGHSVSELLGEVVFEQVIKDRLDRALAGETVHYQEWFDYPFLGRRFLSVTYSPYRELDGTITGVVAAGRDITELQQLNERLRQAQKMEAVGQLAAGLAHHYNSMLTTIIGYTSLSLRQLPPQDATAQYMQQVLATSERAAVLVRQLLAFARKQILQPKNVNLNEQLFNLKSRLEQLLPPTVELVTTLAPDLGQVNMDPSQFEHLLTSLVTNACEAMPAGGRLTLTTANASLGSVEAALYDLFPGDYVLLTVKDTGPGLPEEIKPHLFEPFFTTKDVGQGLGLGLAMCFGIAKQHGGHLVAVSQPEQGATFILYLPRLALTEPLPDPAATLNQFGGTETILLVEADPPVRKLVTQILSRQGYTVLEAADGRGALHLMSSQPQVPLHLLLADRHMPHLDGPMLAEWFKTSYPDLKALFFFDQIDQSSPEPAWPGMSFIAKPFTPSYLAQKVRAVLDAELT